MNRPTTARSARVSRKKMFLAFRICARPISSKKERTFFFLGFCPPSIPAVWRGGIGVGFCETNFFGERISKNTRLIFFEFGCRKRRRRGLGRNPPLAPLFSFGEIRANEYINILYPDLGLFCNRIYHINTNEQVCLYKRL